MSKNYEFAYQSTSQKAWLIGTKVVVAVLMAFPLYTLGWEDEDLVEKLDSIALILTAFWVYARLLTVKVEVQELFVQPIDFHYAKEFMIIGLVLFLIADYLLLT